MGRSRLSGSKHGSILPESALILPMTLLVLIAVIRIACGSYLMLEEKICCDRWARHSANENAGTIYSALRDTASTEVKLSKKREGIYTHVLAEWDRSCEWVGTVRVGAEKTVESKHVELDESRFIRAVDLALAGILSALTLFQESGDSGPGGRDAL